MTDPQANPPAYAPPVAGGPVARFNTLAIVAFVLAFVVSLGAVICGHISLSQIKKTGERGHGLALAAVILGYVGIVLGILWIVVIAAAISSGMSSGMMSTAP